MQNKNTLTTTEWLRYGLGGFLVGACIVGVLVIGQLSRRPQAKPVSTESAPTFSDSDTPTDFMATLSISASPVVPLPNLLPEPTQNPLNVTAELAFNHGNYQKVVEVLGPELSKFTQPDEQKQAYWYLGQAEYNLGQFQLAAGYFEKLYALEPSNTYLLALASAYDDGGNTNKALEMYLRVLASDDPSIPAEVRLMIQDRVNTLQVLASGATLTPLPIP